MNCIVSPVNRRSSRTAKANTGVKLPMLSPVSRKSNAKRSPQIESFKKQQFEEIMVKLQTRKTIKRKLTIRAKSPLNKSSSSTNDSDTYEPEEPSKMLTKKEEKEWISIHSKMIEQIKSKVEFAKKSRFLGFVSPRMLNMKLKMVQEDNQKRRRCLSIDAATQKTSEDSAASSLKSKLSPFTRPKISLRQRAKEFSPSIDMNKVKISAVLNMLSLMH
mmetsp:Transcript_15191/g.17601  ORF Transcript_15191/g.17601 Transcript_15191/m.17601 type:complete len:217 (-) Transcript_15191:254-904(-)